MAQINISPKQDFLERVSTASPIKAVSELIWNGIDAGADNIEVTYKKNGVDVLESIEVKDDGSGINGDEVEVLFGAIGESWKRNKVRYDGRYLHGRKGEGRFKAFALGGLVIWDTVYSDENGTANRYKISGCASPCSFEYSDIEHSSGITGTVVTITNIGERKLGQLFTERARLEFAKIFAPYLSRNPNIKLCINGERIIPNDFYNSVYTETLDSIVDNEGNEFQVQLEILEWKQDVERGICLCDSNGIELRNIDAKLKAKGVKFTILLKSDFFANLDKTNDLELEELQPDVSRAVSSARELARGYFRARKAKEQASIVARWREEDIYPYDDRDDLTPIERAERQVFDIVGVNVEDYLPKFDDADKAQRKFTFRLLAQAITNNPESLQKIITEVLDLKKEDQDDLADLLRETELTNVIKSAKTVANRLDFLTGLQNLLFDKETKKRLLERDQLHKILEKEAWLFDENFALTVSEATLQEVLELHIAKLGKREDDVSVTDQTRADCRVDLMFSLANRPRLDQTDHLIVELKRPSKKIDQEVISQIKGYAFDVAADPHFDKAHTHWKFIAVSNEFDKYAEEESRQDGRPKGCIYKNGNVEIWIMTWTEIIDAAKARLQFINQTLSYNANRESATTYLKKKYAQYIPDNNHAP